jgi:hypothetical protein
VVAATVHSALRVVVRDRVSSTNSLVIGAQVPVSARRMAAAQGVVPPGLRSLLSTVAGQLGPAPAGGRVFTDDLAPVEWLTDLSILRYATAAR